MLVDAHAIIYRAYFAFPPLSTSSGAPVGAVYGFTRILLTAIREMEPDYIAVMFDHKEPTFRHEAYEDYKANRPKMPADLQPQIGVVKEVVDTFNMPSFELAGFEADDLIGTLSVQAAALAEQELEQGQESGQELELGQEYVQELGQEPGQEGYLGLKTVIVTGDKDLFQLVNNHVHVYLPGRGRTNDQEFDAAQVVKKMGVRPDQIVDLKALMGDSSDNIPGIQGVGPKTAVKLLQEFETLEKLYEVIDLDEPHPLLKGALLDKLISGRESAFLSQRLALIDTHVPIELDLSACKLTGYDKNKAVQLLQDLEFRTLINLLPNDAFETSIQESLF